MIGHRLVLITSILKNGSKPLAKLIPEEGVNEREDGRSTVPNPSRNQGQFDLPFRFRYPRGHLVEGEDPLCNHVEEHEGHLSPDHDGGHQDGLLNCLDILVREGLLVLLFEEEDEDDDREEEGADGVGQGEGLVVVEVVVLWPEDVALAPGVGVGEDGDGHDEAQDPAAAQHDVDLDGGQLDDGTFVSGVGGQAEEDEEEGWG